MNTLAAFHQPIPLSCGHEAEAILHLKEVEVRLRPFMETNYEMEAILDHIEYVGITIKDKKFVCMQCGADVLEIKPVIQ